MPRLAEPHATKETIEKLIQQKLGDDWRSMATSEFVPQSDLKIIFNFENFSAPWKDYQLPGTGYYEVNGTTIALCKAGGDWEYPVYFAVYVERGGKKLRAYVPTVGNCFDIYCKTAFGSQGNYGNIDPDDVWPDDLINDEDRLEDWQDYVEAHISVNDMLEDIGSRIEGAEPCKPLKKKHNLKYNAKKLNEWIQQGRQKIL